MRMLGDSSFLFRMSLNWDLSDISHDLTGIMCFREADHSDKCVITLTSNQAYKVLSASLITVDADLQNLTEIVFVIFSTIK